jgi:hypothetical protein
VRNGKRCKVAEEKDEKTQVQKAKKKDEAPEEEVAIA